MFSVWVAAWGKGLADRYLASREFCGPVPSLRPNAVGGNTEAARQDAVVRLCCMAWLQLAVAELCGATSYIITLSYKKPGNDDLNRPVLIHRVLERIAP
jgi:hypothetical protein